MLAALTAPFFGGCSSDTRQDDQNLTSRTARERTLRFEGFVYAHPDASEAEVLQLVHQQTRSAFGALLTRDVVVAQRELANVDPTSLRYEPLTVPDETGAAAYETLRVRYRYVDRALVPVTMLRKSRLKLGLLHGDYQAQAERVLSECSLNTAEEREMQDQVWYVFNPSLKACIAAMNSEQKAIDTARRVLSEPENQVVAAELERLYIPMSVQLESVATPSHTLYPEYDRLWTEGVVPGQLNITLLNGMIDHAAPGKTHHPLDDAGYFEMMEQMEVILEAHPDLKLVASEPATDLSTFQVSGKSISGLSFQNLIDFELYDWGYPSWMSQAEKMQLRKQIAQRLSHRWFTFEKKFLVSVGTSGQREHTVRIHLYFGVDDEPAPYRRGVRQSDVFLYNGHSFIGEGPLDPANFKAADFPSSYQLFFIDSCLSFNYYNADYFDFKTDGSNSLDVISNGLESFSDGAGSAQGRFVVALLSQQTPSYKDLLKVAESEGTGYKWGKDALRVVDGELDNRYQPSRTPIVLARP